MWSLEGKNEGIGRRQSKQAEATYWAHRPQHRARKLRICGGTWEGTEWHDMIYILRDGSDCLDEECMLKIKSEIGRIVYTLCVG